MGLLISLAIGCLVGFCASKVMGLENKWYINLLIGVVGSFVGGILGGILGAKSGSILGFVFNVIGACLVIYGYQKYLAK